MSVFDSIKKTFSFEDDYEAFQEEIDIIGETKEKGDDNLIKPTFFKRREQKVQERPRSRETLKAPDREAFRTQAQAQAFDGHQALNIVEPHRFDDAVAIVGELKNGQIVVINTNKMELKTAQRLLDFVSGAAYCMNGDIQEVMESIYVVSPPGISVKNSARTETQVKSLFSFK